MPDSSRSQADPSAVLSLLSCRPPFPSKAGRVEYLTLMPATSHLLAQLVPDTPTINAIWGNKLRPGSISSTNTKQRFGKGQRCCACLKPSATVGPASDISRCSLYG
eukprot:47025-Amphidinium_carterae.2